MPGSKPQFLALHLSSRCLAWGLFSGELTPSSSWGERRGWPRQGREKVRLRLAGRCQPMLGRERLEGVEWRRIRMDCRG